MQIRVFAEVRGHPLPLETKVVTPLCSPELAAAIRTPSDPFDQSLIEWDNKKVRWTDRFAANGPSSPWSHGPQSDRSFLSISAAMDRLGVALESARLAEPRGTGRACRDIRRSSAVGCEPCFI
ncbi:MAG: hypothetical protein ACRYG8_16355 [Janthinobacterium lividum]